MVVDIDVSKFFDPVHHRRLRGRIALRVSDRRLPALVRRMLTAGVVGVPTKSPILWGAP
jgi:retron-type reverse transcriptase